MPDNTITIQEFAEEIQGYWKKEHKVISTLIDSSMISPLDAIAKPITKINGEYPSFHSVMSHVVQGFTSEWTPMGDLQFRNKVLRNYHQKVNYPIKPTDVLGSYLATMRLEGTDPAEQPISKYAIEELVKKIAEDVEMLSVDGSYDDTKLGEYGFSMKGINTSITEGLSDTRNPYYKIPLDAFTEQNFAEQVTQFEKKLPRKLKKRIKAIVMSENNKEAYQLAIENSLGSNLIYHGDVTKTRLGKRPIIGIPGLRDDVIMGTVDGNLLKLLDIIEKPGQITDIQKQDYSVKIFIEFSLGYDFAVNELVAISNTADAVEGLGSASLMEKYYPEEV